MYKDITYDNKCIGAGIIHTIEAKLVLTQTRVLKI